ncbi:toll-like receptor Tollo isoform X2 [Atheta coriaria]
MLLRQYAVSWWLILIWLNPCEAMCPHECTCRQSEKGRRRVTCTMGGMADPLPTAEMAADMEVLEIGAPADNWNALTLGQLFQNFKALQELHIRRSTLTAIGMHAFWGVPSLRILDLPENNITTLLDHNFRGLVNLVELNLESNRIDRLPIGAFRHLSELRVLNLERNLISDLVPKVFMKMSKLEVLKTSWNPISELDPEVFKDILELRVWQCRGCHLKRINTQIYHLLPYLAHLDLGQNRMQFLEADEFIDLHRLRVLKLDGNQLPVVLERTFVNNVHLRVLCLARNRIAKITNTAFLNLTNLVELDIGYNKLDRLEADTLHPISEKLQKLIISGNNFGISVIRLALQVTPHVTDLAIADLKLKDLPKNVIPSHVQHLNLSGNYLSNLSDSALPEQLLSLDLRGNPFRGLDDQLILRLEHVHTLHLDNITWTCELCHISPMLFRVNTSVFLANITCMYPMTLRGVSLASLNFEDIKQCGEEVDPNVSELSHFVKNKLGLIMGASGLLIFLVICVLFVVISCVKRHATHNADIKEKEVRTREIRMDSTATAIFVGGGPGGKNEISFKFPLDLTERKLSVSTIDEMKKETMINSIPNGTGTGI